MVQKTKTNGRFITILYGWNSNCFDEVKLLRDEAKRFLKEVKKVYPMILVNGVPVPSEVKYSIKSKQS
jgi:hypothetical protein